METDPLPLVCPWCAVNFDASPVNIDSPDVEVSRSPFMAVLRIRSTDTAECPKCMSRVTIAYSQEQRWGNPHEPTNDA